MIVALTGFIVALGLNELDNKVGVTDRVISYIEPAQQEFVGKAKETHDGILDLGAIFADDMLKNACLYWKVKQGNIYEILQMKSYRELINE